MGAALDLFKVLFEPKAVFERVREKPTFLAPFIPLAVVLMIVTLFQAPYQRAAMAARLATMAQQNPQAAEAAQRFSAGGASIVGIIAAPIVMAIVLVIVAGVLWVLVSVVGGEGRFTTLLSVATYATVTRMLLSVAGVAVLMLKGTTEITSMADLQPAFGLDLLAPGATGFLLGVLKGINPFAVWGAFLTATGIAVTHRMSKGSAWAVALTMMVLGVVLGAGGMALASR